MKLGENLTQISNNELVEKYKKIEKLYPILKGGLFKYENGLNKTYFDFLGFSEEDFKNLPTKQIYEQGINKFDNLIKSVNQIINKFEPEDLKEQLFLNNLKEKILWLNYLKAGFIFELEKSGKDISDFEEIKIQSLKDLERYNTLLYGESLLKKPEWIMKIYKKVFQEYHKNKIRLSDKEEQIVNIFLNKLKTYVPRNNFNINKVRTKLENKIGESVKRKDILSKKLSANQAKRIFELVLEIYSKIFGIKFSQKVVIENRNSVGVNFEKLMLIDREYTIYHIVKLIAHEVEKHITKYKNMEMNFDKMQDANYVEMEESTAVIFENIVLENKIPLISKMLPITIAGEIFDNEKDLKTFILAYLKLIDDNLDMVEKRFQRIKQGYPYYKKGAWRKGIVYSTGIPKVIEFIEKGEVKKLFLGAFSYETLVGFQEDNKISRGYQEDKSDNIKKIEDYFHKIVYPVLLAEVLKYIIDNDLIDEIFNGKPIATKKLVKHLQEKYGQFGIDIKQEISKLNKLKRENKNKLSEIEGTTRERIVEILKIMKNGK